MFKQSDETTAGKPSGLIATPFIRALELDENDEFLIIACDGVWDVFDYQEAVDFVAKQLTETKNPQKAAEAVARKSLEKGSRDNITALVVTFNGYSSTITP
jgi:serine/threonine protein phosphatase PrpC